MLVGCPQARVLVGVCFVARVLHLGAVTSLSTIIDHLPLLRHIPTDLYGCYTARTTVYSRISTHTVPYRRVISTLTVWVRYGITPALTRQDMAVNPLRYGSQPYSERTFVRELQECDLIFFVFASCRFPVKGGHTT